MNLREIVRAARALLFSEPASDSPGATSPENPMLLAVPPAVPPPAAVYTQVSAGDHEFAANLYKAALRPSGNLFLSPASVRIALAMAASGALGDTAAEMQSTLQLPPDPKTIDEGFSSLLHAWNGLAKVAPVKAEEWQRQQTAHDSIELHVVNRLWGQTGHKFHPAFLSTLEHSYGAPLEQLDFEHATEQSRKTINHWVARQTADKIQELIGPGVLRPDARLVLTNAIYFKAAWSTPFHKGATFPQGFTNDATTSQVPTMQVTESLAYGEVDHAKVLELPYADGALSMVVVLPDAKDGLPALESSLTGASFDRWLKAVAVQRVHVSLPKFKTDSSFRLAAALQSMGMKSAFQYGPANFSGMDGGRDLFIGDVLHKAFIDVNEEGTEAAAATAVMMVAGAAMPMHRDPPKEFKADHPFFFFIRDVKSGAILFAGRITDPA